MGEQGQYALFHFVNEYKNNKVNKQICAKNHLICIFKTFRSSDAQKHATILIEAVF